MIKDKRQKSSKREPSNGLLQNDKERESEYEREQETKNEKENEREVLPFQQV